MKIILMTLSFALLLSSGNVSAKQQSMKKDWWGKGAPPLQLKPAPLNLQQNGSRPHDPHNVPGGSADRYWTCGCSVHGHNECRGGAQPCSGCVGSHNPNAICCCYPKEN